MPYDIIAIGGASRDIFFQSEEILIIDNPEKDPLRKKLMAFELGAKLYSDRVWIENGGGAANIAVSFANFGFSSAVLARVGSNSQGDRVIEELKSARVSTELVQRDFELATSFSFVLSREGDKGHTLFSYRGANDNLVFPEEQKEILAQAKWLAVSSLSMADWQDFLTSLVHVAEENNIFLAWNPGIVQLKDIDGLKKFLPRIEILVVNQDEATAIVLREKNDLKTKELTIERIAQILAELGPRVVVITCGKQGAYAYQQKKLFFQEIIPAEPVNTTGAGDAFYSGFVAGFIYSSGDIQQTLRWGARNASGVITQIGAQKGLLILKQIKK